MPLPPAHKRVIFNGRLTQATGGGAEIYSWSFASTSTETDQQLAEALDPGMQGNMGNGPLGISTLAVHTGTRVESIDDLGKVVSSYGVTNGAGAAGVNSNMNCTLLSQAITLETGMLDGKGRKVRGRFYPPAMGPGLVGSTFDGSELGPYVTAWATFLSSLNTIGAAVAVASSTSAGIAVVTGITTDNIIDTQRRRKNQVTSVRSAVHTL